MSLSQIHRAATAPQQLDRLARSQSTELGSRNDLRRANGANSKLPRIPGLDFDSQFTMPCSTLGVTNPDPGGEVGVYLIPGGRFMLLAHRASAELALWDLGCPGLTRALYCDVPQCLARISLAASGASGTHDLKLEDISKLCVTLEAAHLLRIAVTTSSDAFSSIMYVHTDDQQANGRGADRSEGPDRAVHVLEVDFTRPLAELEFKPRLNAPLVLSSPTHDFGTTHLLMEGDIVLYGCALYRSAANVPVIIYNYREGWYAVGPTTHYTVRSVQSYRRSFFSGNHNIKVV